ncbi:MULTISPECIES: hypothetical protein [unclassified Undibacterium]|uniref:hypothetical protein n=1 Tax=unclassified Undibacterium TaxID=2630295 RepID=UPI002AC8B9F6|nr:MULTISPECIES: hypothetical protein [unclassified Undibacterium]MEB0138054.1 hypothetical protein [Undibacterium sp. CCC2.1]MEB0171208.1 hypothetical protein [Undibacterium sp. CCC1.1]MEB0175253.1 hypothetical protein [Undibacterium sp. CCC3.4]MEB0214661.1 hypothetical protein [Undibacterium sp. 5I2]WPX42428.1 hypothetical protein RHM61_13615 [Undibacterium sp. CCC3.4]
MNKSKLAGILAGLGLVLVGCGGFVYTTVSGTVTGLGTSGTNSLVLRNEGNYHQSLTVDGTFSFNEASNAVYAITVATQPNLVNCSVANGSGTMNSSSGVANVAVTCVPNVQIVGSITGLPDGDSLYLNNNITNTSQSLNLDVDSASALTSNGTFVLPTYVVSGDNYNVTVSRPPAGKFCTVANGAGLANNANAAAAANVTVACVSATPVTVTVTGLTAGNTLVLTDTSTARVDNLTLTTIGVYNFNWSLLTGMPYKVAVLTQPTGQTCSVQNASGVANLGNPAASANVVVNCI